MPTVIPTRNIASIECPMASIFLGSSQVIRVHLKQLTVSVVTNDFLRYINTKF